VNPARTDIVDRVRSTWRRIQDLVYYSGEYVLIGFVGQSGPRRLVRRLFRIPIMVYRYGLGPVIGHNVLVLHTTGRRSGRPHATAMRYEYNSDSDTYCVLSGWQGNTDWYRNVSRNNQVDVHVGTRRFTARAELLPSDATVAILRVYVARNPLAIATIRKETGIDCGDDLTGLSKVARHFPAVALRP
jgi:deazaflavin-dependent oxidoreductase (nitroreductase family)